MIKKYFSKSYSENFNVRHIWNSDVSQDYALEHVHLMPELLYILKGNLSHVVEDREYRLVKGDLVIIPPMRYHQLKILSSPTEYERYNILFPLEILHGIDTQRIFREIEVIHCSDHGIISDGFKKLDYYAENLPDDAFRDIVTMLLREIFHNLSIYDGTHNIEPSFLSPILSKALTYINDNLFTIQSISEISQNLFITDSYLFDVFKSQLKTTPKRYITMKRLLVAQNAIQLGKKPTEIYSDCGFSDYTSFYRSYVHYFGHAPSQEQDIKTDL